MKLLKMSDGYGLQLQSVPLAEGGATRADYSQN